MAPTDGRFARPEWRWDCRHGTPFNKVEQGSNGTQYVRRRQRETHVNGLKCLSSDSRVSMLATLVNANFCSSGKCLNTPFYTHTHRHITWYTSYLDLH